MAVLGKQRVRVTEPWVTVTQQHGPVGKGADHYALLTAGRSRDHVFYGWGRSVPRPEEIPVNYVLDGWRSPGLVAQHVVDALVAQGYRVVEKQGPVWRLELADPSAPDDPGATATIRVTPPAGQKFFARLQRWTEQGQHRRRPPT